MFTAFFSMAAAFSSGKSRKLWPDHFGCYSSGGCSTQVGKAVRVEEIRSDLALTRQLFTRVFCVTLLHTVMEGSMFYCL